MKAHRGLIAVALLQALLLSSFAPLIGALTIEASCGCNGDSCCLLHGRPDPSAERQADHADPAGHGAVARRTGHDDHVGHDAHPGHADHSPAARSAGPGSQGAPCHGPLARPRPAADSHGSKIAGTCGGGSPTPAPLPLRRDATPTPDKAVGSIDMVTCGEALGEASRLPLSLPPEPPTPPPRSV